MENTANELIKLFKERLKYPIITVYGIILIIYNWDVLAVFFISQQKIERRINYINQHFSNPYYERLWIPLFKAVLVSILAPFIMWLLDLCLQKANKGRTKIKNQKYEQTLAHNLAVATTLHDIEQAKSGSETTAVLRQNIEQLNESLKIQQDQYIQQISILNKSVNEQRELILNRESEYETILQANKAIKINLDSVIQERKEINKILKDSIAVDTGLSRGMISYIVKYIHIHQDGQLTIEKIYDDIKQHYSQIEFKDVVHFVDKLKQLEVAYLNGRNVNYTDTGNIFADLYQSNIEYEN